MKKRYKLLIMWFISFILVIIMYFVFFSPTETYVAIGSNLSINKVSTYNYIEYVKYYNSKIEIYDYTIEKDTLTEVINKISTPKLLNKIRNSRFVSVAVSGYELNNYKEINEEIIVDYLLNMYVLLEKLHRLNHNIYLINLNDSSLIFINNKIHDYAKKFDIKYIDHSIINKSNIFYVNNCNYVTFKGHSNIARHIVK